MEKRSCELIGSQYRKNTAVWLGPAVMGLGWQKYDDGNKLQC